MDELTNEQYESLPGYHRGVPKESICMDCLGAGIKTAIGIGGQMITNGVCDKCWGSGDAASPWTSHKEIISLRTRLEKAEGKLRIKDIALNHFCPCPDHRDKWKTDVDGCAVCAKEEAEEKMKTLAERMMEALKPFAKAAETSSIINNPPEGPVIDFFKDGNIHVRITRKDFSKAKGALEDAPAPAAAKMERMREALEFYGRKENYINGIYGHEMIMPIELDAGAKARAAMGDAP